MAGSYQSAIIHGKITIITIANNTIVRTVDNCYKETGKFGYQVMFA